MIEFVRRKTIPTSALLATVGTVLLLLSGCLVSDDEELKTLIDRDNNTLHTIKAGDFMEYRVAGQVTIAANNPQFVTGTLTITWENTQIPRPFGDTPPIDVLKEITTLTLGSTSYETLRYIKQQTDGTIDLYAFDGANPDEYYRVGPDNENLGNIAPVSILHSDVKTTGTENINYKIAEDCKTGLSCTNKIMSITNNVTYQGDAEIQTDVGKFNTLRLDYDGSLIPSFTNIATIFDIRSACDESNAKFGGNLYIFPQVGIVRIDQRCNNLAGGGHDYTAVLTNTNIAIPKPK
ncbi:MAG: hypothetical protein GXP08_09760 [Gammaproteobacteria bacterium]|nr:hypothetical protein [Gammaproteobacteria bacterium]